MNLATATAKVDAVATVRLSAKEQGILDHVLKAVAAAEVHEEPFCHFYVRDVFPADVYGQILRSMPSPELYHALNLRAWIRPNGESTRDRLFLSQASLAHLPKSMREFWTAIAHVVTSDALKQLIFEKLAHDLALRFQVPTEAVDRIEAYPRAVLFRDTEGYRIKPHPDGANRIVTMQYYLPEDASQEDLGTSLYVEQSLSKRLIGERFKKVKRFPFLPNSAYAFVVNTLPGRTSWHGRETIAAGRGVRNTILAQFRTHPEEGEDY
jgi:hypothetical protein